MSCCTSGAIARINQQDAIKTLVHGPVTSVTLKYDELAEPITENFYTKIELDAFLKGIKLASRFIGEPQILSVRQ